MNQTIRLHAHQNDAVWRGMSSGNTLLAQAVGAGKTFTMAATGKKMKQAGLIGKPLYVVPNHLLEQFGREFMQLYPNARLLSATAPDFPGSKVNALVENVAAIWNRTAGTRAAQMIFCDMGVHPTPWGYSAYGEIIHKLLACGIPREQIAAVCDADSDAKKQSLFKKACLRP